MIKYPLSRFTYTGYRKDRKKLYNSATLTRYPGYTSFNNRNINLLYPSWIPSSESVSLRMCIRILVASLSSTILFILDIKFFASGKMNPFLTRSFSHLYRDHHSDNMDINWII